MREAERTTGLTDWGWYDIHTPLEALVRSINAEARLHAAGEQAFHARLAVVLASRLRTIEDRNRLPEIAGQIVRRPIVIPGLPRSGTTVLLQLLAQDPANRSPLTWEILSPSPPPRRETFETDPRIASAQDLLDSAGLTRPELMAMHPFGARLAEECIFICEHAMALTPYGAFWNTPSYAAETARIDDRIVFQVHKEILQHLQFACPAERWVLKAPTHLHHLDALVATYPDAMFIQTHRDLSRIIPSLAKLFSALRRTFSDDPAVADIRQAARGQLLGLRMGLDAAMNFRARPGMDERFVDVEHAEILARPIEVIERIYDRFGLPLNGEVADRMRAWATQNPPGGHGVHSYSLSECGLSEAEIDEHYGDYLERYNVARERGE
jgi:hypothetical protein